MLAPQHSHRNSILMELKLKGQQQTVKSSKPFARYEPTWKNIPRTHWKLSEVSRGMYRHIREDLMRRRSDYHKQRMMSPLSKEKLKQTVLSLCDKITNYEDRSRHSNLRLVGLPEKTEGRDMCGFLEKWLPGALGNCFTSLPVIERAHRIGPLNPGVSTPRVVIMKFLNYRDREAAMSAARKKETFYESHRLSLFPDLSPETRRMQRRYDGVKAKLRTLNIRYGMLTRPCWSSRTTTGALCLSIVKRLMTTLRKWDRTQILATRRT